MGTSNHETCNFLKDKMKKYKTRIQFLFQGRKLLLLTCQINSLCNGCIKGKSQLGLLTEQHFKKKKILLRKVVVFIHAGPVQKGTHHTRQSMNFLREKKCGSNNFAKCMAWGLQHTRQGRPQKSLQLKLQRKKSHLQFMRSFLMM